MKDMNERLKGFLIGVLFIGLISLGLMTCMEHRFQNMLENSKENILYKKN